MSDYYKGIHRSSSGWSHLVVSLIRVFTDIKLKAKEQSLIVPRNDFRSWVHELNLNQNSHKLHLWFDSNRLLTLFLDSEVSMLVHLNENYFDMERHRRQSHFIKRCLLFTVAVFHIVLIWRYSDCFFYFSFLANREKGRLEELSQRVKF